jgi:hypothetical protein
MSENWREFVKQVYETHGCSYKDAMKIASAEWKQKKGGAVWKLTPEQKQRYIEDKKENRNMQNMGSYTVWKG